MAEKHKPILLLIWVLVAFRNSSVTILVALGKLAEIGKCLHMSSFKKYIVQYLRNYEVKKILTISGFIEIVELILLTLKYSFIPSEIVN